MQPFERKRVFQISETTPTNYSVLFYPWLKLPIFAFEGRVTLESIKLDLCMLPFIIFGGFLGIVRLRKLPQKIFEIIIQALVVIASLRLLWG